MTVTFSSHFQHFLEIRGQFSQEMKRKEAKEKLQGAYAPHSFCETAQKQPVKFWSSVTKLKVAGEKKCTRVNRRRKTRAGVVMGGGGLDRKSAFIMGETLKRAPADKQAEKVQTLPAATA